SHLQAEEVWGASFMTIRRGQGESGGGLSSRTAGVARQNSVRKAAFLPFQPQASGLGLSAIFPARPTYGPTTTQCVIRDRADSDANPFPCIYGRSSYSLLVYLEEGGILAVAQPADVHSAGEPGDALRAGVFGLEGGACPAAGACILPAAAYFPAAGLNGR